MNIIDMYDVQLHYGCGPGRHWFDADTLRFFKSRLPAVAYQTDDGLYAYFVTSERPPNGNRAWTVRRYSFSDRDISSASKFMAYGNRTGADRMARRYAETPPHMMAYAPMAAV